MIMITIGFTGGEIETHTDKTIQMYFTGSKLLLSILTLAIVITDYQCINRNGLFALDKRESIVAKVILVDLWFNMVLTVKLFNGVLFLGVLDALKSTNQVFTLIPLVILDG